MPTRGGLAGEGSSPHTRGLHVGLILRQRRAGIIPAHAGFTGHTPPPLASPADHPRTRGVYTPAPGRHPRASGSSPHTRGLLARLIEPSVPQRIIPAHAGFTRASLRVSRGVWDHPRTRGVYRRTARHRARSRGSSPHTRGLPRPGPRVGARTRIIPAHAGFTRTCPTRGRRGRDHPRTRGVYFQRTSDGVWVAGSSPHTRGLPRHRPQVRGRQGIIPAHAGFTWGPRTSWPCMRDHPRTRGVYAPVSRGTHTPPGSSPHTRGLPRPGPRVGARTRIIPAHAGFTIRLACRCRCHPDHPRTRGVYAAVCRGVRASPGSSPHTRGLLTYHHRRPLASGIIPAHAGFTPDARGGAEHGPDHPRTRGVYAAIDAKAAELGGSSPHTRGLLWDGGQGRGDIGIIPAHAGFT